MDKKLFNKSLSRLWSAKTGILNAFHERCKDGGEPGLKLVMAAISDTSRLFGKPCVSVGSGAAWRSSEAMIVSIGEGIERYCGIQCSEHLISKWASYTELRDEDQSAIGPEEFPLFSPEQYAQPNFPFAPWTEDMTIEWIQATSLGDKHTVWVPASFVLKGYQWPEGTPLHYDLFAGVACGYSLAEACLSAFCEVIERDALMLWWLLRLPLPRVELFITPKGEALANRLFLHTGFDFIVIDITLDWGLPTVFAAVFDPYRGIASGGCATRFDFWQAVEKALFEAIQTQWTARALAGGQIDNKRMDGADAEFMSIAFNYHLRPYMQRDRVQQLRDFLESQPVKDMQSLPDFSSGSIEDDWLRCLRQVARRGNKVLLIDLSTSDVVEAGLFVVRMLVPGAVPQSVGPNLFLGSPRFQTISKLMGRNNLRNNKLNHLPVPYI